MCEPQERVRTDQAMRAVVHVRTEQLVRIKSVEAGPIARPFAL